MSLWWVFVAIVIMAAVFIVTFALLLQREGTEEDYEG